MAAIVCGVRCWIQPVDWGVQRAMYKGGSYACMDTDVTPTPLDINQSTHARAQLLCSAPVTLIEHTHALNMARH